MWFYNVVLLLSISEFASSKCGITFAPVCRGRIIIADRDRVQGVNPGRRIHPIAITMDVEMAQVGDGVPTFTVGNQITTSMGERVGRILQGAGKPMDRAVLLGDVTDHPLGVPLLPRGPVHLQDCF